MAIKSGYNSKDYEKKTFTFNDKEEMAGMYKVTYNDTKDMDLVQKGDVIVTAVLEPDNEPEVTTTPPKVESVPEVKKTASTKVITKPTKVEPVKKAELKPVKKATPKQTPEVDESEGDAVHVKTTTRVVKETFVNQKKQVFEYTVEDIEYKNSKDLTKTLNSFGADSWELVDFDVIQRVFTPAQARCVFKRIKK